MATITITASENIVIVGSGLGPVAISISNNYPVGKIKIASFWVDPTNKTSLTSFELNDVFDGWHNNIYYVGKIIAENVILPDDINNISKVQLSINS